MMTLRQDCSARCRSLCPGTDAGVPRPPGLGVLRRRPPASPSAAESRSYRHPRCTQKAARLAPRPAGSARCPLFPRWLCGLASGPPCFPSGAWPVGGLPLPSDRVHLLAVIDQQYQQPVEDAPPVPAVDRPVDRRVAAGALRMVEEMREMRFDIRCDWENAIHEHEKPTLRLETALLRFQRTILPGSSASGLLTELSRRFRVEWCHKRWPPNASRTQNLPVPVGLRPADGPARQCSRRDDVLGHCAPPGAPAWHGRRSARRADGVGRRRVFLHALEAVPRGELRRWKRLPRNGRTRTRPAPAAA